MGSPDRSPNFMLLFVAQLLSAGGEMFGQRAGRINYKHSNLRSLNAVVFYSCIQAFVVCAVLQLGFHDVSKGQGSFSMWKQLYDHPGLWLNAVNNTVYWIALVFVLHEPLGVILVVLAFLAASFLVDPFSAIAGLPLENHLSPAAVVLAVIGAAFCLVELNAEWRRRVRRFFGCKQSSPGSGAEDDSPVPGDTNGAVTYSSLAVADAGPAEGGVEEGPRGASQSRTSTSSTPLWAVTLGFLVLMLTAGIGIVITNYFEKRANLSMVGYAAIDQVLLPITTVPVAWVANWWVPLRKLVGEVNPEQLPGSYWDTLKLTWQETEFLTLVPFRGLMFAREFFFFYLVTEYDLDSTYLSMTLLRMILCWIGSLFAVTFLRGWVGVESWEAATTLAPVNLGLKLVGSAILVLSLLELKEML